MKIIRKMLCVALAVSFVSNIFTAAENANAELEVSAKSAIVLEAKSGRVVYEKNGYDVLPMASTTKIMSTVIALESDIDLDEYFTVDSDAIRVEGSSMGLQEGDRVTLRTLCYGMMLPSGNDAANATAVRVAGSVEAFVDMMNDKAKELGLENTSFVTPSGLDDYTDDHYSTAYDMAVLTSYAVKNPLFREICSSKNVELEYGNPPYKRWLANNNKLLRYCDGVYGVKTGFTDKARRCLVSACERDGVELICVTLNAPDDWQDHSKLYDYGYSKVKECSLDSNISDVKFNVVGSNDDTIYAKLEREPVASLFEGDIETVTRKIIVNSFYYAPVIEEEVLGRVEYYLDGKLIESVNIIAEKEVPAVRYEQQSTVKRMIERIKNFLKI